MTRYRQTLQSGPRLNIKTVFPTYGNSHIKDNRLIFNVGIPILVRHLYTESAPWSLVCNIKTEQIENIDSSDTIILCASNHQQIDLFKRTTMMVSKVCIQTLCEGDSPRKGAVSWKRYHVRTPPWLLYVTFGLLAGGFKPFWTNVDPYNISITSSLRVVFACLIKCACQFIFKYDIFPDINDFLIKLTHRYLCEMTNFLHTFSNIFS